MSSLEKIDEKLDKLAVDVATIKANTTNDRAALEEHKHDLGAHAGSAVTWLTAALGVLAVVVAWVKGK